jgi:glycine/D-amino acid oxidase-like deaminating enzyme
MPSTSDLVVVGAGVMGGWTAFWARRAGLETVLADGFAERQREVWEPMAASGKPAPGHSST